MITFDIPEGEGDGKATDTLAMGGGAGDGTLLSPLTLEVSPLETDDMLLGETKARSLSRRYWGSILGLMGCVVEISTFGLGDTDRFEKGA